MTSSSTGARYVLWGTYFSQKQKLYLEVSFSKKSVSEITHVRLNGLIQFNFENLTDNKSLVGRGWLCCERGSDIEQKIGIIMSPIWAWLKLYFTSKRLGSNRSQIGFTEQYLR